MHIDRDRAFRLDVPTSRVKGRIGGARLNPPSREGVLRDATLINLSHLMYRTARSNAKLNATRRLSLLPLRLLLGDG